MSPAIEVEILGALDLTSQPVQLFLIQRATVGEIPKGCGIGQGSIAGSIDDSRSKPARLPVIVQGIRITNHSETTVDALVVHGFSGVGIEGSILLQVLLPFDIPWFDVEDLDDPLLEGHKWLAF